MRHKEKESHIQGMGQNVIRQAEEERLLLNKIEYGSYSNGDGLLRYQRRENLAGIFFSGVLAANRFC